MSLRSLVAWAAAAAVLVVPAAASGGGKATRQFRTSRTFRLGPGHSVRTFTFRERAGVILLNRLTVPLGVRASVDAQIPGVAGARVSSWRRPGDPSSSCRRRGAVEVCTQGEEWCPMPAATWHFRLVKAAGRAGTVRFDYLVAPPPSD